MHKSILEYCIKNQLFNASRIAFDVVVGLPRPHKGEEHKTSLEAWNYMTSHRIDCLVDFGTYYEIWEIKPEPYIEAVGQCIMYYELFTSTYKDFKPVYVRLVTIDAHPEIKRLCDIYGVRLTDIKQ